MRITFLGTGTSFGVPVVGCGCPVCHSADPRDARLRSSLLVETARTVLLVDAGPEFRLQALRAGLDRVDAVLLTHAHADHIHGLDDLRPLAKGGAIPLWANAEAIAETRERFAYVFDEGRGKQEGGGRPRIDTRVAGTGAFAIGDIEVLPLPLLHGELGVLGWRFGDFAYLTDCSSIPEATWPLLAGLRFAAIDALRLRPHCTHFSVGEALEAARRMGLERTWLTHINHETSHAELEAFCREAGTDVGAHPAADGEVFELPPSRGGSPAVLDGKGPSF
jgi:phosphoribosyl 1,2-cyclic phosphate phosphodiesterase